MLADNQILEAASDVQSDNSNARLMKWSDAGDIIPSFRGRAEARLASMFAWFALEHPCPT